MVKIEFIYDKDCPNIQAARTSLIKALQKLDLPQKWTEWEGNDSKAPDHILGHGSPTILVNGKDINNYSPTSEFNSCRVYVDKNGKMQGVPSVESIVNALNKKPRLQSKGSIARLLALLPVIGAAILPKLTCPVCWPAYAAILGYFSIGFVNYPPYLMPMTIAFIGLILFSLFFRASTRRGHAPFVIGLIASTILIIGKFSFDSEITMYVGLSVLIACSIWNSWPLKTKDSNCPSCQSVDSLNSKTGE